jgi:hypothetical protein
MHPQLSAAEPFGKRISQKPPHKRLAYAYSSEHRIDDNGVDVKPPRNGGPASPSLSRLTAPSEPHHLLSVPSHSKQNAMGLRAAAGQRV